MLNIACVKWGTKYSPEYVNILYDMVRRNLPEGFPGRFVCFTEDPSGLAQGIETRELPPGLIGWWNKLALFRAEAFDPGDRVFFLDLDCVITGKLDDLVTYSGEFAVQREFFNVGFGSAVMAWEAGKLTHIWDAWNKAGQPDTPGGDQAFIAEVHPEPDYLDDIFPGSLASFKRHCFPYPPRAASVVCFHGEPKPHAVDEEWVKRTWCVGGGTAAMIECICNTADDQLRENIRWACRRDLKWLSQVPAHEGHAVIVGGAPSVMNFGEELVWRQEQGQTIFALNGALGFLRELGLDADCHVIVDARASNASFIPAESEATHYLASQCAPEVFDAAASHKVVLWHSNTPLIAGAIENPSLKQEYLVGGGNTVGLSTMALAYVLGYREIHLYGMDSSLTNLDHHAYPQPQNDRDIVMDVYCNGRNFKASAWMISQAEQFQELALELAELGCLITVHGDGLLPWVAFQLQLGQGEDEQMLMLGGSECSTTMQSRDTSVH